MNLYKVKQNTIKGTTSTLRYVFLIGLSFIILYPIIITFLISFMNPSDIYDSAVRFIPKEFSLKNYEYTSIVLEYGKNIFSSIFFNFVLCFIEVFACLFVAYGFARFNFRGKNILFAAVLLTLLVPGNIYFMPLYLQLQDYGPFHWNLIGSSIPLYFMSLTCIGFRDGLIIYILRQSLKAYPKALEEAAEIDGAGTLKILLKIMLPGAMPVMATSLMFTFVWKWTDPTYTELFLPNKEYIWVKMGTIDNVLQLLPSAVRTDNYYIAILRNTATVLYIIPLIVIFFIFKRFLVESVETTGLVG